MGFIITGSGWHLSSDALRKEEMALGRWMLKAEEKLRGVLGDYPEAEPYKGEMGRLEKLAGG